MSIRGNVIRETVRRGNFRWRNFRQGTILGPVKFVFFNFNIAKRDNFFTHFIYGEIFFLNFNLCNTPFCSVELAFFSKFEAELLSILPVMQQ